jgi:hypothetical protein
MPRRNGEWKVVATSMFLLYYSVVTKNIPRGGIK